MILKHYKPKKPGMAMAVVLGIMIAVSVICLIVFNIRTKNLLDSSADAGTSQSHYIFVADSSDKFNTLVYEAMKKKLADQDAYLEFMGQDMETSYSTFDLMKMAVYAKPDGIFVVGDGTDEMTKQINTAVSENIPVICVSGDCYGSLRQSYVGVTYYEFGQRMAQQFISDTDKDADSGERKDVLILTSPAERNTNQNLICSGIRDYIQKNLLSTRYTIRTREVGTGGMFSDVEIINQLFESGDLPDILICLDEQNTTHVCQAVVDTNHVGDVSIYGSFTNDTILSAIRKHVISGVLTVSPEDIGARAADSMTEYVKDGFVTEYSTIDIQTVTADNADDFTVSDSQSDTEDS